MQEELLIAFRASTFKLEYMTNDRIDAMGGSHGTLNIATLSVMDLCVEEFLKGIDFKLSFKNTKELDLDRVIKRLLEVTDYYKVDRSNAALIIALVLYFMGIDTRAGVPAGNRKLGALCRIAAGVPRGGMVTFTSPKLGNKVSAFPALMAVYEELLKNGLAKVKGKNIPFGTIGTLYMHSVLGEDIVLPEIIIKGTEIAVKAIYDSMNGIGMMMYNGMADKISAALLGSGVMLEIVHPDANVRYDNDYIPSSHLVGKIAARTVGLPEKIHLNVTDKEFDTGQIIGDIALILKDSGTPTVICMMGLCDLFAMFKEWLVWTGGPTITPIASLGGEAWIAMQLLLENEGDVEEVSHSIMSMRNNWFDPEISKISLNIIASKAQEYYKGPVTTSLLLSTEGVKMKAVYTRALKAYSMFSEGKGIEEIVKYFEDVRKEKVEESSSQFCSKYFGRKIKVKLLRVEPLGRIAKKGEGIGKFWSLDPDIDVRVEIDDMVYVLERLCEICIPKVAMGEYDDPDYKIAVESASIFIQELSYSGVVLFNVTVPLCVGVAMKKGEPRDLSEGATKAAYISGNIPGTLLKCSNVSKVARELTVQIGKDGF